MKRACRKHSTKIFHSAAAPSGLNRPQFAHTVLAHMRILGQSMVALADRRLTCEAGARM